MRVRSTVSLYNVRMCSSQANMHYHYTGNTISIIMRVRKCATAKPICAIITQAIQYQLSCACASVQQPSQYAPSLHRQYYINYHARAQVCSSQTNMCTCNTISIIMRNMRHHYTGNISCACSVQQPNQYAPSIHRQYNINYYARAQVCSSQTNMRTCNTISIIMRVRKCAAAKPICAFATIIMPVRKCEPICAIITHTVMHYTVMQQQLQQCTALFYCVHATAQ
jgi:hypothetical protein